jgi:hypothetical protein
METSTPGDPHLRVTRDAANRAAAGAPAFASVATMYRMRRTGFATGRVVPCNSLHRFGMR